MSALELLGRLGLPTSDRLRQAVIAWQDGLPPMPQSTRLGFAHLELRVGCWAAPHFYGAAPFARRCGSVPAFPGCKFLSMSAMSEATQDKATVLIVDDDRVLRRQLLWALEPEHEVIEAACDDEAREAELRDPREQEAGAEQRGLPEVLRGEEEMDRACDEEHRRERQAQQGTLLEATVRDRRDDGRRGARFRVKHW